MRVVFSRPGLQPVLEIDPIEFSARCMRSRLGHTQYAERALGMALRIMDLQQAKAWHQQLKRDPAQLRTAAIADGIIGDPEAVADLIDLMNVPAIARVAGEAFSMITGVDLAYEDLSGDKPEGFEAGPTEDPEDENVAMDPDENLPWPVPDTGGKVVESASSEVPDGQTIFQRQGDHRSITSRSSDQREASLSVPRQLWN